MAGVLAVAALSAFAAWEEWVEAVAGIWVALAPWLLGFTPNTIATWTHVVLGVVILAAATIEIAWLRTHRAPAA